MKCRRHPTAFIAAWLGAVWLGVSGAGAGTKLFSTSQFTSVQSRTGQFVVTSPKPPGAFVAPPVPIAPARPPTDKIELEPAQAAVIGERLKEAVLRELAMKDQWRGKILVTLRPAPAADDQVYFQSTRFNDGWQYRLDLPDNVETNRLIRAFTQAVLQEISNRSASERSAEIPLWLTEGLAAYLLDGSPTSYLLNPNTHFNLTLRRLDPLRDARRQLAKSTALSFSDLNLPSPEQLRGAAWETYRRSAQVFVASLLTLPDGRAALREFLRRLPDYLNPQLAFLQAFAAHFPAALDVEKWWSVTLVNFTGRDEYSRWSGPDVLQRLDEILRAPVEVRGATNSLSQLGEMPLQKIFFPMEFARQRSLMQDKMLQLQQLQWNAPPAYSRLIADYHGALAAYLLRRGNLDVSSFRGRAPDSARLAAADAVRQFDLLDVIRHDMKRLNAPPVDEIPANPPPP